MEVLREYGGACSGNDQMIYFIDGKHFKPSVV
jgi:hypothetical protein